MSIAPHYRLAVEDDADAIAELHADSWRRHYRGAYSDAFLDGDVLDERLAVWRRRLGTEEPTRVTIVAELDGLLGFANTYLEEDPRWGALLDNLHVVSRHKRAGVGSRLIALTAAEVARRTPQSGLYLWVHVQNTDGQAFYEARGGAYAGRAPVKPPGGVRERLTGTPEMLRCVWPPEAVAKMAGGGFEPPKA